MAKRVRILRRQARAHPASATDDAEEEEEGDDYYGSDLLAGVVGGLAVLVEATDAICISPWEPSLSRLFVGMELVRFELAH